jgi:agmatine/peptidylarginine deiminase
VLDLISTAGEKANTIAMPVAEFVTDYVHAEFIRSALDLEGGGIEVDGEGTAIITESCVLNPNRNPASAKPNVKKNLKRLLGLDKIIWLPGIAGRILPTAIRTFTPDSHIRVRW